MSDALDFLAQTPLAIAPKYLGYMLAVLQGRQAPTPPRTPMLRGHLLHGTAVVDGIAVVPLVGPIVQRPDLFGAFGAVSIGEVRATVGAAIEDPSVEAVMLLVDSPGGEVAGVADLADALYAARGQKPIWSVADEGIHSAAYWLASAVGPVFLPRTGSVGSIGALVVHQDLSKALENLGVKMTVIKSGTRKAMFSPFQPLSDEARLALQTEVDRIAGLFIDAVARHRDLPVAQIAGYEAGTFEGDAALRAGLADGVQTVEGAFLALKMQLASRAAAPPHAPRATRERNPTMADDSTRDVPPAPDAPGDSPTADRSLVTAEPKPPTTNWARQTNVTSIAEAHKLGTQQAQAAERKRAAEIMHWCAFTGKADLAEQYMASDLSVEQVRNDLMAQTAGAAFEVEPARSAGFGLTQRRVDSVEEIYARRKAAVRAALLERRFN